MTKRVFVGNIGGQWDVRISRPGFDAETADVNDRKKISFAESRGSYGRVAEAGTIPSIDTWYNFVGSYSEIPCAILIVNRGGMQMLGAADSMHWTANGGNYARHGASYVLVVEQTRLKVTRAYTNSHPQAQIPGDTFNFFVVA